MAERAFLHVGTPKSGTTFLQSVWWANRPALAAQGLLLPGAGVHEHFHASCVVRGEKRLLATIPRSGLGAWERVLERTAAWDGDVLISHELFSPAGPEQAAQALLRLDEVAREVHVLLTARDLARQLPAEWQQRTKHGRSETFAHFLEEVRHGTARNFWRVQDVPRVLERWSTGLPARHVHLVVLPPSGGPRSWLWDTLCEVLDVDGAGMSAPASGGNESLGLAEVETLRRLNGRLGEHGLDKSTERLLKGFFAEQMLRTEHPEKIVLPDHVQSWTLDLARGMVADLATRADDVRGRLEDLVPAEGGPTGRQPDAVADAEVADVAVEALARFVRHEEQRRVAVTSRRADRSTGEQATAEPGRGWRRRLGDLIDPERARRRATTPDASAPPEPSGPPDAVR